MERTNGDRRDVGLDLVKAAAIFGVLTIHSCQYTAPVASGPWLLMVFWGSLVRASVPLFLMCSGALFLDREREFSVKKLFTRSIPRILAAMVVWGMFYKVVELGGDLSFAGLWQGLKEVLTLQQVFHFYYLHMILIVYLFLPVTRLFTDHANKRQVQYLLALWFAFGVFYPTVKGFWPFTLLGGMAPSFLINITYASIGYGVLGHYLRTYPAKTLWTGVLAAVAGFALVFGGVVGLSVRDGALNAMPFDGPTVGVALLAAGLFRLLTAPEVTQRLNAGVKKAAVFLSKGSFCVYLVHVFFLNLLADRGITAASFPPAFGAPLLALTVLVPSLAVYWALSHIPVVNRWLI